MQSRKGWWRCGSSGRVALSSGSHIVRKIISLMNPNPKILKL
jgi:hypothetical protein